MGLLTIKKKNQWEHPVDKIREVTDSKRGHLYSQEIKKKKKVLGRHKVWEMLFSTGAVEKKESELGP